MFSLAEDRWIHVDPCQNLMDRPLIYEKSAYFGMRQFTYCIAVSKDEIKDVTWRYL